MNTLKRICLTLWLAVFAGVLASAQEINVSGNVIDKTYGEPVIGAAVMILGTNTGTITDLDGNFQITATVTSGILQGSSINKMAKDLMNRVTDMNKTSAVRAARTAVTEAENAGRQPAADCADFFGFTRLGIDSEQDAEIACGNVAESNTEKTIALRIIRHGGELFDSGENALPEFAMYERLLRACPRDRD